MVMCCRLGRRIAPSRSTQWFPTRPTPMGTALTFSKGSGELARRWNREQGYVSIDGRAAVNGLAQGAARNKWRLKELSVARKTGHFHSIYRAYYIYFNASIFEL